MQLDNIIELIVLFLEISLASQFSVDANDSFAARASMNYILETIENTRDPCQWYSSIN